MTPEGTKLAVMPPFRLQGVDNCLEMNANAGFLDSGNYSSCVTNRKSFFASGVDSAKYDSTKNIRDSIPTENWLLSFDGLRPRGAGLPTPWTFADNSGTPGSFYVRGVYATIGLDGEPIFSNYAQLRLASATKDLYLSGYSTFSTVPRLDFTIAGATGEFPSFRSPDDSLYEASLSSDGLGASASSLKYFDTRFILTSGSPTVSSGIITITRTTISTNMAVGEWLMIDLKTVVGTIPARLYMFQIKTLGASSGTTCTFEKEFKYFDQFTSSWVDADFNTVYTAWGTIDVDIQIQFLALVAATYFSNLFLIVNYSTSASSGYRLHEIYPMAWNSTKSIPTTDFSTTPGGSSMPFMGVVSSLMADWYDVTVVKTTFPPLKGITNYKELLVGFDSNAIYFSDISMGGSTEMTSGVANLIPNGTEYGDIVAICGAEDFLLISRERRNYVVTGDIATSNFSITECDLPVLGAYNARAVANAWAGQVLLMNSTGIYSVTSSGAIKDISTSIKGLFKNSNNDSNLFDKTVFKTPTEKRAAGLDGAFFKIFMDDHRGFIFFLTAKATTTNTLTVSGSNMLVLDTRDGSWYEFSAGDGTFSSAEAMNGKVILLGTNYSIEDGVMRGSEQQLLATQWLTVGEPSMEKQICQLKVFGEFVAQTSGGLKGFQLGQQNDWKPYTESRTLWNTDAQYLADTEDIYSHKKRLNSSKPLVTSLIVESLATGSYLIEGMQVEGIQIQEGVKR